MNTNYTSYRYLVALFFLLSLSVFPAATQAQQITYPFGNEWINYSQTYYKIPVTQNGIHRLDYQYLANIGLTNADPRKFQIFRKGKEQAIYIDGESDGRLDNGDYLEFFGQKNDGITDVELYKDPTQKLHSYFNFYTDTAAYFLTISGTNGKRMISYNLSGTDLTPEAWHYQSRLVLFTSNYNVGYNSGFSYLPWVGNGEGFFGPGFGALSNNRVFNANPATFKIDSILHINTTGPEPILEMGFSGAFFRDHNISVSAVTSTGEERFIAQNIVFGAWDYGKVKAKLRFSDVGPDGIITLKVKVNTIVEPGGLADLIMPAYIKITYPRKNILTSKQSTIALADSAKLSNSYLQFDSPIEDPIAYDITNPEAITRTAGMLETNKYGFVFKGEPGKRRKVFINSSTRFKVPSMARPHTFRQFDPAKINYIIVSNKVLAKLAANGPNPVKAFADYRASAEGGNYDTLVFYVDQLYNQFHYGDRSAVAIRRFMRYLIANGNPKHLFLIGKGIDLDQNVGGVNYRNDPSRFNLKDLVPVGGTPGSDIIYTADFQNNLFHPRVPTGRLSAVRPEEIIQYLEKVKQHESLAENEPWRKNFLHLSGGTGLSQQQQFRNYVKSYENIAEKPLMGANVQTISKLGSTEVSTFINVSKQVNAGLSLMTFFGHSSTTVSDIDIGYVSNPVNGYNNQGKYPMILLNGCGSGNIFVASTGRSFGEDWMLTPNKGAITLVAHSSAGIDIPLSLYSRNFYGLAFSNPDYYGKPVGTILQETAKRTVRTNNIEYITTAMYMVLQGDPAIKLFSPSKPDYTIESNTISLRSTTQGEPVTAASDKYQLVIPVRNLGKALDQAISVSVSLNGETVQDSVFAQPVYYQDTLYFNFTAPAVRQAGLNQFEIIVDHLNAIEEIDEVNNKISFPYNLPASGAKPLLPLAYAIVNKPDVKLIGQATDLLQAKRDYYFELDTSPIFNSPGKQTNIVNAGPFPEWKIKLKPDVAPNDSVVYYWRFRFKDIPADEDTIWGESSFRYIQTSPSGWSQSEWGQFAKNTSTNIQLNQNTKVWEFASTKKTIAIKTAGGQVPAAFPPFGIFVNGIRNFDGSCGLGSPNLLVAVFSNKTLEPYIMPATLAPTVCGMDPKTFYHFSDLRQPQNQDYLRRFLEAVPEGFYVTAVSVNNVPFSTFPDNLKSAFRAVGSRLIDELETGYPFALVGQKGAAAGSAREATASTGDPTAPASQNIELEAEIEAPGSEGTISSTLIGPASEWKTLLHTVRKNGDGNDSFQLQVLGLDKEGKNEVVLAANITDRRFDLSGINANEYPYLRLHLRVADAADRSAPQLEEWMVHYNGVPEGVVRTDTIGSENYADLAKDARKGKIDVKFAFQNISELSFAGELVARITLLGKNGFEKNIKIKPLGSNETIIIPYTFATQGLEGKYTLRLTVNPLTQNPDLQPELYYFNNTLELPFTLAPNLHPVLDVVFDGQHIMDGDIVSPNPNISITLRDEDQYSFIKDPSNMQVFLKAPNAAAYTEVNLTGSDIKYFPASAQRDFKLEYNPQGLADGMYSLRVQGKDGSGNQSGFEPYIINFEVVNEMAVTHFYPYPNPFSSKTRFVFTLTGSTIPENMKIQIMTITGKVVREIMKEELGPIKIGNNISEFAWDGTDEFGDKLANGVYLYRVVMDTGTDVFKHRASAGDKAFKKDYGKLYILR